MGKRAEYTGSINQPEFSNEKKEIHKEPYPWIKMSERKPEELYNERLKERLLSKVKLIPPPKQEKTGGQSAGVIWSTPIILHSEELSIKIEVQYHRGSQENKNLALHLMNYAIDYLIK